MLIEAGPPAAPPILPTRSTIYLAIETAVGAAVPTAFAMSTSAVPSERSRDLLGLSFAASFTRSSAEADTASASSTFSGGTFFKCSPNFWSSACSSARDP